MAAGLLHQAGQRAFDGARAVYIVLDAVDGHGAASTHLVRQGAIARQEHRIAGDIDAGEQRIGVGCERQVAEVAAPAYGRAFGRRRLPDRLLVIVRKQFGWQRIGLAVGTGVLRFRQRHDQRANVELHGSLAAVEQAGEPVHRRMQRILHAVRQSCAGREQGRGQLGAAQGDAAGALAWAAAPDSAVGVVTGFVIANDGVGVVVAAVKKHADQRLVVSGFKSRRLAHGRQVQGKRQGRAAQGQLAAAAQKGAATVQFGLEQVHERPYF